MKEETQSESEKCNFPRCECRLDECKVVTDRVESLKSEPLLEGVQGEKEESQEELWDDVLLITDDPHRDYSRDEATIRQLYNRFTITRKP